MTGPHRSPQGSEQARLLKAMLKRLGISGALLIAATLYLWFDPIVRRVETGWSTRGDFILLGTGAVLLIAVLLPRALRVNLAVLVGAFAFMEAIAALVLLGRPRDKVINLDPETQVPSVGYVELDPNLGYRLIPNARALVRHTSDGNLIYDMKITIDPLGRRSVPGAQRKDAEAFVVLLGDSFTLGAGVNDDQTFPYYLGRLMPGVSIYNYGVGGYGPQHTLALLEGKTLRKEVSEERGIGIYTYIDAHVHRAAFTVRSGTLRRSPHYVLDKDGKVVRQGNFNATNPWLFAFYEEVWPRIRIFSMLRVEFPPTGADDIRLTCLLLVSARDQFQQQFEGSEFLVILYPNRSGKYGAELKKCLAEHRVAHLDYSNEPWSPEFFIPYDNHPNARGHLQYATMLSGSLKHILKEVAK